MKKIERTAIIGMSLGNRYFSEKNIIHTVRVVRDKFRALKIMIPDYPSQYTYRALGEKNINGVISKKGNALRNKIARVIGQNNEVIDWRDTINTHPAYKKSIKDLLLLSKKNKKFRNELQETTKEVLGTKVEIDEEKIKTGVKFLICELAFLISSQEILGNASTYVYHRSWPIFEDLISGKFDGIQRDIEFEIITNEA